MLNQNEILHKKKSTQVECIRHVRPTLGVATIMKRRKKTVGSFNNQNTIVWSLLAWKRLCCEGESVQFFGNI